MSRLTRTTQSRERNPSLIRVRRFFSAFARVGWCSYLVAAFVLSGDLSARAAVDATIIKVAFSPPACANDSLVSGTGGVDIDCGAVEAHWPAGSVAISAVRWHETRSTGCGGNGCSTSLTLRNTSSSAGTLISGQYGYCHRSRDRATGSVTYGNASSNISQITGAGLFTNTVNANTDSSQSFGGSMWDGTAGVSAGTGLIFEYYWFTDAATDSGSNDSSCRNTDPGAPKNQPAPTPSSTTSASSDATDTSTSSCGAWWNVACYVGQLLKKLFVPSSSTTNTLNGLWSDIKTKLPFSLAYEVVTFIPDRLHAISDGISERSGCISLFSPGGATSNESGDGGAAADPLSGTGIGGGSTDARICPDSYGTGALAPFGTWLSAVHDTVLVTFLVLFAWGIYRQVVKALGGGGS